VEWERSSGWDAIKRGACCVVMFLFLCGMSAHPRDVVCFTQVRIPGHQVQSGDLLKGSSLPGSSGCRGVGVTLEDLALSIATGGDYQHASFIQSSSFLD